MKTGRKYTAAKWTVLVLTVGYIAGLLLFAAESRKTFEEVSRAVDQAVDGETLEKQSSLVLKRRLGLNSADYGGVSYYTAVSGVSAEELLLIRVKSSDQTGQITDALEKHIEEGLRNWGRDDQEQAELLKDAGWTVKGNYIFFCVSSQADRYRQVFLNSL